MNRKTLVSFGLVAVLLVAGAVWYKSGPSAANAPSKSPYLTEASSQEIKDIIKRQNSAVVLVNFWASWCEPCKVEFPLILELQQKYASRGLQVIFISIDGKEEFMAAEEFLKTQKTPIMSFVKGALPLSWVTDFNPDWKGAVPMTLLYGPDLKILDSWEGDADYKEFEARVVPHLRGA